MSRHIRLLLLNSSCAFALALMVTITVHELGHALAARAFGLTPTVHFFSVDYDSALRDAQILIALAGPAVSLVTGTLLLVASLAVKTAGFWYLLVLWLGALGVQECFGYLMTAPFVAFGDIGKAMQLLSAPGWIYALLFVVGALGTVALGLIVTRRLLELTDASMGDIAAQLRSLGLFAWLIGSAFVLVAGGFDDIFSPVGVFEAVGMFSIGIFLLLVRFFMRQHATPGGFTPGVPVPGLALLVAVAVARYVIFAPGLRV